MIIRRSSKPTKMFIFKVLAAAALTATAASGRGPDPWGENVQPNMHTDYLHQFPGKPQITFLFMAWIFWSNRYMN